MTLLDKLKIYTSKHPVTFLILILNTVMFFYVSLTGGFTTDNLIASGGLVPKLVTDNNEYYRLVLAMFLHGGILHFFMNMYFLYYLGSFSERLIGSLRYTLIYMIGGLGSSVAVWLFEPSTKVTVGASGALYAIMATLLLLTFTRHLWFSVQGIRTIRSISFLNISFTILSSTTLNISFWGHMGGLVFGLLLAYILAPVEPKVKAGTRRTSRPAPRVIIDMDDVTDKDIYQN